MTKSRKSGTVAALPPLPGPMPQIPNTPQLTFADEIVELWEWMEANKSKLARWEKLKTATKETIGPGEACTWVHRDYEISVFLVPKTFTRVCKGCPGEQVPTEQQTFKVRRLVAPPKAAPNAA